MEIRFANYRFLPEPLILYFDNELIPLKRNQAVLLQFFLSEPEKIHSKNEIMDSVWQGKVVSEQVVFQTISQLRSILGENAIQTFSKKGYKWQLSLEIHTGNHSLDFQTSVSVTTSSNMLNVEGVVTGEYKEHAKKYYMIFIASLVMFIALALFYYLNDNQAGTSTQKRSIVMPVTLTTDNQATKNFNKTLFSALTIDANFNIQSTVLTDSVKQLFSVPKLKWQQANLEEQDWLLWGEILPTEKGLFFRYDITNDKFTWQGYVFHENLTGLELVFIDRLRELNNLGVFAAPASPMDLPKLSSIHKKSLSDPEITLLLAQYYINANQKDVALTYLDQVIKQNHEFSSRPYIAKAYYYMGKTYKHNGHYDLAQINFEQMDKVLAEAPLPHLRVNLINARAWLAYAKGETKKMFEVLADGLSVLKESGDPLSLFELHILYSILAEKTANHDKKYDHLNEAQALLLQHNLDQSNLAIVYYHFALFSQNNDKATPYLKRILALPRTTNNYWVQDQAFELLVQNYIMNNQFVLAHSLFENELTSPVKMVLKADIYQAQNQSELAVPLLINAFEVARLEYDIYTGLRAALSLYRLTKDTPNTQAKYWAYLEGNAEKEWLEQHNVITASK
jgi:DNA-binding winged helix-turn-helix (wHTH) protein/tetratricopeptide (TPR) repeat protein